VFPFYNLGGKDGNVGNRKGQRWDIVVLRGGICKKRKETWACPQGYACRPCPTVRYPSVRRCACMEYAKERRDKSRRHGRGRKGLHGWRVAAWLDTWVDRRTRGEARRAMSMSALHGEERRGACCHVPCALCRADLLRLFAVTGKARPEQVAYVGHFTNIEKTSVTPF
jgi:hypothetical protein